MMVVFKKRDSVPSVFNVLRQWRIWLIPTYRVYRLYDKYSIPSVYYHAFSIQVYNIIVYIIYGVILVHNAY